MPLLEKKLFKRNRPPKDLDPNEELFYCKVTNEVFREYEALFERVILCNSLVWTCALTGKSNLTFQEALDSEEAARHSLITFPTALKKPVLYLASLTERGRLNDMCDDVFLYVKDRFFVGEEVEVVINGVKKSSEVTQVILPEKLVKSPVKADARSKKSKEISPTKIKYEVVNYSSGKTTIVKADCISRPKGAYTKPRNKLFLKSHTQVKDGVWKVKDSVSKKTQLHEFQFSEAFSGPPPSYASPDKRKSTLVEKVDRSANKKQIESSGKKTVQGKLNFKKESADEKKKSIEKLALTERQKLAAEKERQKAKENLKKQLEEEDRKSKEKVRLEKLKEKEKKKEEKRKIAEYLNSWKKPRDDLECDDLKELPSPMPIDCGIPQNCFGDALMILEFLNTFGQKVQIKDIFPQGITLEHIERALVETDIQGVFNDILQLFLTAIFRYQEAEDDIVDTKNIEINSLNNLNIHEATLLAEAVSKWPQKYHGTALRNIPLDSFSITEVLRLHILSSGAKKRFNWQGITGLSEDPGLYFKLEEPNLLNKLAKMSVFDLNSEDRCKILSLLINQLLSCDDLRYAVDENADKTRPLRHQLKQLKWAHSRKEKDLLNNKKKGSLKDNKIEVNSEETHEDASTAVEEEEEEKENTDNLTPEEKAELEEKKIKEAARQKSDFLRKEREIESQIRKLQSSFNVAPIGKDRAYRRYWIFPSVAGLFVEDDDPLKGSCLLKQTVQVQSQNTPSLKAENPPASIKKYLQSMDTTNSSSDKENDILRDIAIVQSDLSFPVKNRKLTDLNPRVDSKKHVLDNSLQENDCLQCKHKKIDTQDNCMWYCPHSKNALSSDQCSANIDTCPVHNINAPRTKWSFYYTEEDLDVLISCLNSRGFRERALKENLVNEKERIKELLTKCPSNMFNKSLPPPPQLDVRKSQRLQNNQNSSYSGMTPHQALEITLRDMILELEHRIFAGGLGSLKVSDRESWRTSIEQVAICLENVQTKTENSSCSPVKEEKKDILPPLVPPEQSIQDLAKAMLELSVGIEAKYLHPPLGESDEQKKSKQKSQDDPESLKKKTSPSKNCVSPLERWQESLLRCTSASQLFVHLGTLERSVAWSRSVLKAHCRICRRRGDAENMLLCDGCNRGHHLYCLKPPLKAIPEGDWFCLSCKPIEKPESPQKNQLNKIQESESESSENESEEDEEEEIDDEEEDDDDESLNDSTCVQEACEACGDVGTLLCCDKCPLMYHPECVNLKRIPRGEWLCPKCNKKDEAVKKAQKHPSSGTYGTRSSTISSDNKKSNSSLKTKIGTKGVKRKYEESFEAEFEPPTKKSNRERKLYNDDSERDDNPFKKVYKDSSLNTARRRSKTVIGSDMLDYKACIDLLVELMRHPSSWPFLIPVSKKDAPDYHQIIKRPMDFGTIRSKLNYMSYKNNEDFVRDIYLVLQNCEWFNPKNSPEYKAAQVLYKEVKRLIQEYQICNTFSLNERPNVNES